MIVPPRGQVLGYHDNPGGRQGEEKTNTKEEEEEDEERERRASRRLSVSLWEGFPSSPVTSRSAPFISSDESESENEEMWVLRER